MDNYRSEWVLAQLKRKLVDMSRTKNDGIIWYSHEAAKSMLSMLAEIEADSVLGTPEVISQEVDKLLAHGLPGGDTDCTEDACPVDLGEVDI